MPFDSRAVCIPSATSYYLLLVSALCLPSIASGCHSKSVMSLLAPLFLPLFCRVSGLFILVNIGARSCSIQIRPEHAPLF
jgi:hypothetical protein